MRKGTLNVWEAFTTLKEMMLGINIHGSVFNFSEEYKQMLEYRG